jgi:hypothetical protein
MESANHGLYGRFVQRWSDAGADGVYGNEAGEKSVFGNADNLANSINNFDSHLLPPGNPRSSANYVGIINFDEDIGGATFVPPPGGTPPFPNNTEAAGITVSTANGTIQPVLDLAYIVVPNDFSPFNVGLGSALIAVAGGAPQLVVFAPAEPATIIPLGFCAALSLVRPRRKDRRRSERPMIC